jgi:hypothetical protein
LIGQRKGIKMDKQFLVVWSDGYEPAENKLVTLDFFSEDNGYEVEDLEAIDALAEGQELDLSDLGGTHTVTRSIVLRGRHAI